MTTMLKRAAATQACMDRFAGRSYAPGVRDCGKLAAHSLHKLGRRATLLTASRHTTEAGAVRYIRKAGFKDLVELMDAVLPGARIPPAAALPGDIVAMAMEDGDPFGCSLTVALDNGRILGFKDGVCQVLVPLHFVTAWQVLGPAFMGPPVYAVDDYDHDHHVEELE